MTLKKFYYYSPTKLKLIPIKDFIPKAMAFLAIFAFSIIFISVIISYSLFSDSDYRTLKGQDQIIEKEFEKELEILNKKYQKLATKFEDISNSANNVRLAINLEPLDINIDDYGIGGSEFVNSENLSPIYQKEQLSSIYDLVSNIEMNLKFETSNFEEINNKFEENKDLFQKLPAIRPVKSAIGDRFGMRYHPILKRRRMHYGLDFLANTGEEVFAPGDGKVTFVGIRGGYGKVIRINHDYGYETIYGHLSKYKVKKGQVVKRGELIGLTGNSGSLSTGPHLHYEVRHNGVCLNPRNFIFEETKLFADSY